MISRVFGHTAQDDNKGEVSHAMVVLPADPQGLGCFKRRSRSQEVKPCGFRVLHGDFSRQSATWELGNQANNEVFQFSPKGSH